MNLVKYLEYVKFISTGIGVRPVGSNGLKVTRDYIEKKFKDFSLDTSFQQFDYNEFKLENIIGVLKSKNETAENVLLCAHYDSVPSARGAKDNASGVAVLLELARNFSQIGGHEKYNLIFIALSGEEVGCVGSKAYCQNLSVEEINKIKCVYVFDMFLSNLDEPSALVVNELGKRTQNGYQIGDEENPANNLISQSIKREIDNSQTSIANWCPRHYGHSDHQSFHEIGIDSANVTIRGNKERNAKLPRGYHSEKDIFILEELDLNLCENSLNVVFNAIKNL